MIYQEHKVKISAVQKKKLERQARGGKQKQLILHLKKGDLDGDDVFLFTKRQLNKIEKAKRKKRGVIIKMSARQIKANMRVEGGFLSMLAGLLSSFLPTLVKKVAPSLLGGLATGLVSGAVEKAVSGHGIFLQKEGHWYKVDPVEGNGLYLSPHPHLDGVYENGGYKKNFSDGLYVRAKNGRIYNGKGLILGKNSPFKNIPLLGWIL